MKKSNFAAVLSIHSPVTRVEYESSDDDYLFAILRKKKSPKTAYLLCKMEISEEMASDKLNEWLSCGEKIEAGVQKTEEQNVMKTKDRGWQITYETRRK